MLRCFLIASPTATKSGKYLIDDVHGCSSQVYAPLMVARSMSIHALEHNLGCSNDHLMSSIRMVGGGKYAKINVLQKQLVEAK